MKMKWIAWVQHMGSRTWHNVASSEYFDKAYQALTQYVSANHVTVKFHIIASHWSPDSLPSDFPEPMELRG